MPIVVVTGVPRSGTSMMMRMLEAGGVPCVYEQRSDQHNPDGYYESESSMSGDFSAVPDGHAVKCLQMLAIAPDTDAQVIIMRRDPAVSLNSANRVALQQNEPLLPVNYAGFLGECMDSIRLWCAGKPHIEVWYDDIARNTAGECLRIRKLLGRDMDLAAMAAVPYVRSL